MKKLKLKHKYEGDTLEITIEGTKELYVKALFNSVKSLALSNSNWDEVFQ